MSAIRGKNTKPELLLRHAIHQLGFRYRLHDSKLPGRPDIVFPKHQAAVQVHGCYWHRHSDCPLATTPSSNIPFWKLKFAENRRRDRRNLKKLQKLGWRVAVVWECAIDPRQSKPTALKIAAWLRSRRSYAEIPSARSASSGVRPKAATLRTRKLRKGRGA